MHELPVGLCLLVHGIDTPQGSDRLGGRKRISPVTASEIKDPLLPCTPIRRMKASPWKRSQCSAS